MLLAARSLRPALARPAACQARRPLPLSRPLATVTRFSKTHEYVTFDEATGVGVVGVSDYAQSKLGDVVYLDLPDAGAAFKQGDTFGSIESVKAASDLYLPVAGKILAKNAAVVDKPQLVNEAALGDGWLVKIAVTDKKQVAALMDAKSYEKHCAEEA